MSYGYIYLTRDLTNNKIYIGQHMGSYDKTYYGSGSLLKREMELKGTNSFTNELIELCDNREVLNEREIYYINYYNSRDEKIGYNIKKGGSGYYKYKSKWKEKYEEYKEKYEEYKEKYEEYKYNQKRMDEKLYSKYNDILYMFNGEENFITPENWKDIVIQPYYCDIFEGLSSLYMCDIEPPHINDPYETSFYVYNNYEYWFKNKNGYPVLYNVEELIENVDYIWFDFYDEDCMICIYSDERFEYYDYQYGIYEDGSKVIVSFSDLSQNDWNRYYEQNKKLNEIIYVI